MKRVAIWIGGALLLLLMLGLATVAFALSRFDARAEIERQVETALGRDLTISGPVGVNFFPVVGFRAEDVALANLTGGDAVHLMTAKSLTVGVGARALMQRRIEVHELVFAEPQLNLEVDAAGQPNWVFKPAAPSKPPQPGAKPAPVQDMRLQGARIVKGRIAYANRKTNSAYVLDDVDMDLSLDSLDQPLQAKGAATYQAQQIKFETVLAKPRALLSGGQAPLSVTLKSDPVDADFEGSFDTKSGGLVGAVTVSGADLRNLARWIGAPLGAGAGFANFSVVGQLKMAPKSASFENASLTLDSISGRGDFLVETSGAVPLVSGRLELTAPLDLNPYLAPRVETAGAGPVVTIEAVNVSAPEWSKARIDLTGLKAFNANLELTTQAIQVQKIKLDRSRLSFVLAGGKLVATLSDMGLYGGAGTGQFELDGSGPEVAMRQKLDVKGLAAAQFLADAVGFGQLEGAAELNLDISGRGATQADLMKSLTGNTRLSLTEGGLKGVDLGGLSRTIGNALDGKLIAPNSRTGFSKFSANFRLVDGVAATKDLRVSMADAEITAAGVIDIGGRSIDLRLTPKVKSVLSRLGGPLRGAGVSFPFHVSGRWDKIGYVSDLRGQAKAAVEARARAILDAPAARKP
jgi:AsmA protein